MSLDHSELVRVVPSCDQQPVTGLREHRHEGGSWQGWELENQAGDFFGPCIHINHKKVEGREETILIQMLSLSCGLQHI